MVRTSFLLSLATLTVAFSGLSAQAETVESTNLEAEAVVSTDVQTQSISAATHEFDSVTTASQLVNPDTANSATEPIPGTTLTSASALSVQPSETEAPAVAQATPETTTSGITAPTDTAPSTTTQLPTPPETTAQETLDISPGRATRSGASYIGIAGNIGLGDGDTAVGESSFAAISKIGLTRFLSVRPSVFIDDDPTILLPLTVDFVPQQVEEVEEFRLRVAPYIGAGAAISIGDDTAVDFLGTAGLDVPLTPQFTATAAVNVTGFDNIAVGLLIGVGYNFVGF
ncbi:MAG TPA: hypothetical protein V6C91_13365 [Coleofasciculaceae cyanobacterium]